MLLTIGGVRAHRHSHATIVVSYLAGCFDSTRVITLYPHAKAVALASSHPGCYQHGNHSEKIRQLTQVDFFEVNNLADLLKSLSTTIVNASASMIDPAIVVQGRKSATTSAC